jgi:hypothetical protein
MQVNNPDACRVFIRVDFVALCDPPQMLIDRASAHPHCLVYFAGPRSTHQHLYNLFIPHCGLNATPPVSVIPPLMSTPVPGSAKACPVPARVKVCVVPEEASSITVSVPEDGPDTKAVNVIGIWQICPAAKVAGLRGQVSGPSANGPVIENGPTGIVIGPVPEL